MVQNGHIVKVQETTEWVSSMVAVLRDGKVRICMNQSDLNKIINREHYSVHTIEEVVSGIPVAKLFSEQDAKSGFPLHL